MIIANDTCMTRSGQHGSVWVAVQDATAESTAGSPDQFSYDFKHFTLADMVRCGTALRQLATQSTSLEEAAQKVTRHLYDKLVEKATNRHCCVLVRFFKTHAYARMTEELREYAASKASSASLAEDTKCLTLLGTAGDDPQWNSRRTSTMHKCIPLTSEVMIEQFPMMSQLIHQLGLTTSALLRPSN